jgi:hypothetical protein
MENLTAIDRFDGDFDMLPLRAHVVYGEVPLYPIEADFHHAVSVAFGAEDPAAEWRVEAVRWRLRNQGQPLSDAALKTIAVATAKRLQRRIERSA